MSFSLIFVQVGEKKALESDTKLIMTFNSLRVLDASSEFQQNYRYNFFSLD